MLGFPVAQPHDDTPDFSIEPASLAVVLVDSAWQFRTAARFNTAVGGSDAAAQEIKSRASPTRRHTEFQY